MKALSKTLSNKLKVSNFLKDRSNESFTQTDLVKELNLSKATISRRITALTKAKDIIIKKEGKFNKIKWIPKTETETKINETETKKSETETETKKSETETETKPFEMELDFKTKDPEQYNYEINPDLSKTEIQETVDSLNLKNKLLLENISTLQALIEKQITQIENHSTELLERETTIENLITKYNQEPSFKNFPSLYPHNSIFNLFMKKLDESNSYASKHLKEKINVKGKYRKINKERVIRIIRDTLDVILE